MGLGWLRHRPVGSTPIRHAREKKAHPHCADGLQKSSEKDVVGTRAGTVRPAMGLAIQRKILQLLRP
jgi:hypothetical protein